MFQKTEILTFAENDQNLTSSLPHSITLLASRGNGTSVPTRHVSLESIDTISRYLRNEFILECSWNHGYFGSREKQMKPEGLHVKFARDPTYS